MLNLNSANKPQTTRRDVSRRVVVLRAMSLLELTVVVAMIGMLTVAAVSRYGHDALASGGAEGFARKLALSLNHARRATISTGDNHFVQFNSVSGSVVSYDLIRRASGGNVQVDETRNLPSDVSLTSSNTVLEFDFDGSGLGSYSVVISAPDRNWNVSVDWLAGAVQVTELP